MVSIVVPVYNKAEYLNNCIESLVRQNYSNIEILLIDDGSTDGSGAICDQWSKLDRRIKTIHQQNKGVSAARNLGIDKSVGEYITFVDADDTILDTAISTMVAGIKNNKSDIWISGLDLNLWSLCGYDLSKYLLRKRKVAVWGSIYKTALACQVRFPEKLTNSEDFVYFFLISLRAVSISGSENSVYEYNLSAKDSLSEIVSIQKLNSSLQALEIIKAHLPDYLNEDYKIYKLYIFEYILTNLYGLSSEALENLIIDIPSLCRYVRKIFPQWMKNKERKDVADKIKLLGFFLCPNLMISLISLIKGRRNGKQN